MGLLEKIQSPADLKSLSQTELQELCGELRSFLVENVSRTGGHLASNLGVVELAVAIELVFDTSRDRLVFDVGHQCYVHKILTGRREEFSRLRQTDGIAGFPKPKESRYDAFVAGHASNSISVALGMARAIRLTGSDRRVIALLGDGALTGGMAYEALSDAGVSKLPVIVILNDNGMSIAKNVGGMSRHLAHLRIKPGYMQFKNAYRNLLAHVPCGRTLYRFNHRIKSSLKNAILHCSVFEDMGFQYVGPVDGHDVKRLTQALTAAKILNQPVLLHVMTKKGKGYAPAEENPDLYHGVLPFDAETGRLQPEEPSFSSEFGAEMVRLGSADPRVCAVTAAMKSGTGLTEFARRFPDRFVDVGIAEEHAAAMCAGEAAMGAVPVFAVYSTFLQRSFDMLIHDVAILHNHVVFAVDRAGLVGADGETHHGAFDVAYLSAVPGMTLYAPASFAELRSMLESAVEQTDGPVAVRYPKGGEGRYKGCSAEPSCILRQGTDVTIVSYGIVTNAALDAADILEESGVSAEIVKLGRLCPLETETALASAARTGALLVLEDVAAGGCVGEKLAAAAAQARLPLRRILLRNLGTGFVQQGHNEELYRLCGIDAASAAAAVLEGMELDKKTAGCGADGAGTLREPGARPGDDHERHGLCERSEVG